MRKIFSILGVGVLLTLTACSDVEDVKDLTLDRVLMPCNLTAVPSTLDPEINLSWTKVSNADKYVVQAFTQDPSANESATAVVTDTVVSSETTVEYKISDLAALTQYYVRVKGVSATTADSKWASATCTTKDEQILAVHAGHITETAITLYWPKAKKCNSIKVLKDGTEVKTVNVADYTTGQQVVDGLQAGVTYTFEIYNGTARRGNIAQTTIAANPVGDYNETLTASSTGATETTVFQNILDNIAAKAAADGKTSYTTVITIASGQEVRLSAWSTSTGAEANVKVPDGMSLTITGASDDMTSSVTIPVVFDLSGTHANITFQKLVMNCGSYLVNQSGACDVDNITIQYCDIPTIGGNTLIRYQNAAALVSNVKLYACNIYGDCNNYYLIDLRKSTVQHNVSVENCTIANYKSVGTTYGLKGIFLSDHNVGNITLKNSTFYNCVTAGNFFVDAGSGKTINNFNVTGCIFSGTLATVTASAPFRPEAGENGNIANNVYTNDVQKTFTEAQATLYDVTADKFFTDIDSKDFTVKISGVTQGDARKSPLPYAE